MSRFVVVVLGAAVFWSFIAGGLGFEVQSGEPKQIAVVMIPYLMVVATAMIMDRK